MASVALGDIYFRFAWQGWHLLTSAFVSRGRCGTWRHLPSFRVPGVALGNIHAASESNSLKNDFVTHTHTTFSRTIFYTYLSHMQLYRTQLCHTQLCHTQLCHTPSFTHTTLSQRIFHTQLGHTHRALSHAILVTHQFVTHTTFHTTLSHIIFLTHLCHTH